MAESRGKGKEPAVEAPMQEADVAGASSNNAFSGLPATESKEEQARIVPAVPKKRKREEPLKPTDINDLSADEMFPDDFDQMSRLHDIYNELTALILNPQDAPDQDNPEGRGQPNSE